MAHETIVKRTMHGDLQAETRIPLGFDNKELRITTSKWGGGKVTARASVVTITDVGYTFAIGIFGSGKGDYSKTVAWEQTRATEKAIRRVHAQALAQAYGIEAEARAHYAPKVPA
jgi:hypothetical protein